MPHDRVHAKEPTHDSDRWRTGSIEDVFERDGHGVFVVTDGDEEFELTVTLAIRDLVLGRLDIDDESPVGSTVWYRRYGRG
jgi:hypothetical protein